MAICYDKLWKLLIDKKMNRTELKEASGISFNVLARLGKNEPVSFELFLYFSIIVRDMSKSGIFIGVLLFCTYIFSQYFPSGVITKLLIVRFLISL